MEVRVRFAPSPTGGLHLGGIRTVLFNYLFAKKHNGKFILRIEDTDQKRYVEGAEQYITESLEWCGLTPDESPDKGGNYGPYRQSERKHLYKKYADQLVKEGKAYYAFDTAAELEAMREQLKAEGRDSLQYDHSTRLSMKNSITLSAEETKELLENNTAFVIRIKVEAGQDVIFTDMIRGEISMNTDTVDDKVLMKADGMPTYHLAVVVDDYLMKITHAFRGEEWLPSAPVHVLLWDYLFGRDAMPRWAHLPLILKPDGNGKLSKRDGDRLGFPVYALNWKDADGNTTKGFKEVGFLPEAFCNLLAVLGWNDGTEKELYTMLELIDSFSMDHVHKGGAKFDYEKAKWYNHEWIKTKSAAELIMDGKNAMHAAGIIITEDKKFEDILELVKERCTLLTDIPEQAGYFYKAPIEIDTASIMAKWNADKTLFFQDLIQKYESANAWTSQMLEQIFKDLAGERNIKPGELQLPLRIMLVGGKFGPGVFEIASQIGKSETNNRIQNALNLLQENSIQP